MNTEAPPLSFRILAKAASQLHHGRGAGAVVVGRHDGWPLLVACQGAEGFAIAEMVVVGQSRRSRWPVLVRPLRGRRPAFLSTLILSRLRLALHGRGPALEVEAEGLPSAIIAFSTLTRSVPRSARSLLTTERLTWKTGRSKGARLLREVVAEVETACRRRGPLQFVWTNSMPTALRRAALVALVRSSVSSQLPP